MAAPESSPGLKVFMVTGIFPPEIGGPATQCFHLCQTLQAHGTAVFVVTFGRRTGWEQYEGIRVYRHRLSYPGGLAGKVLRLTLFGIRLARLLRKERPDVIHCHDTYPHALIAGLLGRLRGRSTIVKFAGDLVYEKINVQWMRAGTIASAHQRGLRAHLWARFERWGLRRFDVVWAASEFRRRNVEADLGVAPGRVRVIPNYIRLPQPDVSVVRPDPPPFVILCAGRFAPHKRVDRTLEIFAALDRPGARLCLVGGGSEKERRAVQAHVQRLGVGSSVDLLGTVSYKELVRLMQTSHVLLSTSEEEGFGIVFVEAMSVGLPVVALRIGAIPEVVPDGKAGYLVEAMDSQSVLGRLRALADDPGLRMAMGEAGRRHAQRYDLQLHWVVFTDLYRDLVHQRAAADRRPRAEQESR